MITDTTIFSSGKLLLPTDTPPAVQPEMADVSIVTPILVIVTILICALFLSNIVNALPAVIASFTKPRGLANLEGSVRLARDRNITATLLTVPFCLVASLSGLYSPDFLDSVPADFRPIAVTAVFLAYLFLRLIMYLWFKPRHNSDCYSLARRSAWNTFIIATIILSAVFGVCRLAGTNPLNVKLILTTILGVLYAFHLIRQIRFLSAHCGAFTTFLYLCTLELLPTGLLVASASLL